MLRHCFGARSVDDFIRGLSVLFVNRACGLETAGVFWFRRNLYLISYSGLSGLIAGSWQCRVFSMGVPSLLNESTESLQRVQVFIFTVRIGCSLVRAAAARRAIFRDTQASSISWVTFLYHQSRAWTLQALLSSSIRPRGNQIKPDFPAAI